MNKEIAYGLDELPRVAQEIKKLLTTCKVVTYTGPLGAGKTTLIKEILKQCGIQESVTSPTFTYMNMYENDTGERWYHFDLYRIENREQFLQAGFDEYLYQPNSWAFIEWPEHIMPLLTRNVCHIHIEYDGHEQKRILKIKCT